MKALSLVALSLAMLLQPSIVAADWQNTKWGMPEQQVRGLVKNLVETTAAERDKKRFANGATATLKGRYMAGDLEFGIELYFGGSVNGLAAVNLDYSVPSQCAAVLGAMEARYGTPETGKNDAILSIWSWRTERDVINLIQIGRGARATECSVNYQPRQNERTKGL